MENNKTSSSKPKPSVKPKAVAKPKISKNVINIYAPVSGKFKSLSNIKDEAFKNGLLGEGFYIEPNNNKFFSPIDGDLITAFPTGHAFGIKHESGQEVLLHIGLDTVNLNGAGFELKVKQGDKVTKATQLVEVNLAEVKKQHSVDTPVIFIKGSLQNATIKLMKKNNDIVKAHDLVAKIEFTPAEASANQDHVIGGNKYLTLGKAIIDLVGGQANVKSVHNCATRLRFQLVDFGKVNRRGITSTKGVKGDNWAGSANEYQVIIGPEAIRVNEAIQENVLRSGGPNPKQSNVTGGQAAKVSFYKKFIRSISGIFGPLIPFYIAIGMVMAFQQLFVQFGWMTDPGRVVGVWEFTAGTFNISETTPITIDMVASHLASWAMSINDLDPTDGIIALDNTMLAEMFPDNAAFWNGAGVISAVVPNVNYEAAYVYFYDILTGKNPTDAMSWGGIFPSAGQIVLNADYHTHIQKMALPSEVSNFDRFVDVMAKTGFTLNGPLAMWSTVRYFKGNQTMAIGIGLLLVSPLIPQGENAIVLYTIGEQDFILKPYYNTVLVFIALGIIYSYLEKGFRKVFNPTADQVLNPTLTFAITFILSAYLVGPAMQQTERWLGSLFDWIGNWPLGLGGLVFGATWQLMVLVGVNSVISTAFSLPVLTGVGSSVIMACTVPAVFGQIGAALAVGAKSKTSSLKGAAFSASAPGLIAGVTEPIIYGINVPRLIPFIAGSMAGAVGGWMFAVLHIDQDIIIGMGGPLVFLGFTDGNELWFVLFMEIAMTGLGFALCYVMWNEKPSEAKLTSKVNAKILAFDINNAPEYAKFKDSLIAKGLSEAEIVNQLNAFKAKHIAEYMTYYNKLVSLSLSMKELNKQSYAYMKEELKILNSQYKIDTLKDKEEEHKAKLFDKMEIYACDHANDRTSSQYLALKANYDNYNLSAKINELQANHAKLLGNTGTQNTTFMTALNSKFAEFDAVVKEFAKAKNNPALVKLSNNYYNAVYAVPIMMKKVDIKDDDFPSYYSKKFIAQKADEKIAKLAAKQ